MKQVPAEDILEVIGCEIDQRPDAPSLDDLRAHMRGVVRAPQTLTISFAPQAADTIEAFAAAERVCCSGITWTVQHGLETTLQISTNEAALDAIQQMITTTI